jgi:hypothetical protein
MKATQRLELTDKIGRELQRRFGYREIDQFLEAYKISPPNNVTANSKWVYSCEALRKAPSDVILKIAEELEIEDIQSVNRLVPPRNWQGTADFRLFISHISKSKDKATRLKTCLSNHAVSGFVAHEDIHPTLEWQLEIERALHSMDAFLAIHTVDFSKSMWTQQEIGFAVGKGTKIISLKMGEDPTGFISKRQALSRRNKTAEEIAQEIADLLLDDAQTRDKLKAALDARLPTAQADELPF